MPCKYLRPLVRVEGEITYIPLTQGKEAKIDTRNLNRVSSYSWHVTNANTRSPYAATRIGGKKVRLHNFILGVKGVDHRNGDGLDNREENLRPASHVENMQNQRKKIGSRSIYKGVYYVSGKWKRVKRWVSEIHINGCKKCLGYFMTEREAGEAYNKAVDLYKPDFGRKNILESVQ